MKTDNGWGIGSVSKATDQELARKYRKLRQKVRNEQTARGLASLMNETKWRRLVQAIREELPFPPPYQRKDILEQAPQTEEFKSDVWYLGDWGTEATWPYFSIEWLCVRPRYQKSKGLLLPPEVIDESDEFRQVLLRLRIPHRYDGECFWIYGYAADTSEIRIGNEPGGDAHA